MPPKRANLPAELFNMKSLSPDGEEVEEEEDGEESAEKYEDGKKCATEMVVDAEAICPDDATSERLEAAQLNSGNGNIIHDKCSNSCQNTLTFLLNNNERFILKYPNVLHRNRIIMSTDLSSAVIEPVKLTYIYVYMAIC